MLSSGVPQDDFAEQEWIDEIFPQIQSFGFELAIIGCVSLGLGLGLGFRLHAQGNQPLKSVASSIKFADGVVKGVKAVHGLSSPNPAHALVLAMAAAKVLAKSASRGFIIKDSSGSFKKISKGLKASEGALNLVKYSKIVEMDPNDMGWDSVIKGYKLSKSVFNVFEGVNAFHGRIAAISTRGFGVIKGGLEGLGVVIKAFALSKQMYAILVHSFGISRGAFRILFEEHRNARGYRCHGTEKRNYICLPSRKRNMVFSLRCHLGFDGFACKKTLPLADFLTSSFVSHQSVGSICDYLFYLSIPCTPEIKK